MASWSARSRPLEMPRRRPRARAQPRSPSCSATAPTLSEAPAGLRGAGAGRAAGRWCSWCPSDYDKDFAAGAPPRCGSSWTTRATRPASPCSARSGCWRRIPSRPARSASSRAACRRSWRRRCAWTSWIWPRPSARRPTAHHHPAVPACLAAFLGGMHVAIDTMAGERERGSLEPLLLNPVPRGAVVVGKWLATCAVAGTACASCGSSWSRQARAAGRTWA